MLKRLLGDSLSIVFGNLETVFKVSGAWIVLQFLFGLLMSVGMGGEETGTTSSAIVLAGIVSLALSIVSTASISVAWHRFGLLHEIPGYIHLKVGAVEGRFILKSLGIMVIALVVGTMIGFLAGLIGGLVQMRVVGTVITVIGTLAFMPHILRLSLVLPATAIERPLSFRDAHAAGEGLGWQMIAAVLIFTVPFVAVLVGFQLLLGSLGASLPIFLIQMKFLILSVLVQIIVTVLSISVITAAYRIAMERQVHAGPLNTPNTPPE